MTRASEAEDGFGAANRDLGRVALRRRWKLLVDLRGAPQMRVDPLLESAFARLRLPLYEGFARVAYLIPDRRRKMQMERCERAREMPYRTFFEESEARAYLMS